MVKMKPTLVRINEQKDGGCLVVASVHFAVVYSRAFADVNTGRMTAQSLFDQEFEVEEECLYEEDY